MLNISSIENILVAKSISSVMVCYVASASCIPNPQLKETDRKSSKLQLLSMID